ncbi:hypothetical protein L7F22_012865 [Adiantum nelumboides]|nr:hypothetical protein [Adiantum nelumboides]
MDKTIAFELRDSLCSAWDDKSASNKVFLMKKLMRLSMKEGSTVSSHLNEFNALYSQLTSKGVDFDEIFSPVFKMTTLRLVLGLVATEDLELKSTFLHGDLEEDVYMALYGLKQGSRQWYLKFDKYMQSQGYDRSQEDHCLYTLKLSDGSLIILILYVDDMLIAGKDEIANLKKSLCTQFVMKDLGDANNFLGMRIKRDRQHGILELSQEQYVHKVLERFSMQGGNTLSTPMQPCLKLSKEAVWLARLVGDLGIHQIPVLHCDSQSAITLAKNPMFHSKTKHIEI